MKVLIVVTHLLGTGHLARALTLARAFTAAGHQVRLVSGGLPVPHLARSGPRIDQLPPLQSDGTNFTRLLNDQGQVVENSCLDTRRRALKAVLTEFVPDVLITELFPFGRRVLTEEFVSLLEAARNLPEPPLILASIRDILAPPSSPAKAARTEAHVLQYYDGVLVHSDPGAVLLDQSWPVSSVLAGRLRYTGYVTPEPARPHTDGVGAGEVLVTAGGGSVGTRLFETAIRAAQLTPDLRWRLLVGGADPAGRVGHLRALAEGSATRIEAARPDFRQMLHHAAASVSQCGYNTALEILQSAVPAVLVPFDEGHETEQSLRAASLSQMPGIEVLAAADLSAQALLAAVLRARKAVRRPTTQLRFDGAAQSVAIASDMLKNRK